MARQAAKRTKIAAGAVYDRAGAIARARQHIAEARITRHRHAARDAKGRALADILAAFDPAITYAAKCPEALMPGWLAHLGLLFNDEMPADARWKAFCIRFVDLVERAGALSALEWERARIDVGRAVLERAMPTDVNSVLASALSRWIAGDPTPRIVHERLLEASGRAASARRHVFNLAFMSDPTSAPPVTLAMMAESAAWAIAWAGEISTKAHMDAMHGLSVLALDIVENACVKKHV